MLPFAAVAILTATGFVQAQPQVFHSEVEIVPVAVSVEKADGSFVENLDAHQFRVFDQGIPQPVAFFSDAAVPVDLVLMLDTSDSMGARIPTAKRAAVQFVNALGLQDRAAVVRFAWDARTVQPLTGDRRAVIAAIEGLTTSGNTALYDSLYIALKTAPAQTDGGIRRQALVVFSDGDDTNSMLSYDAVRDEARQRGMALYIIRLAAPGPRSARSFESDYELRQLARDTGAQFFPATTVDDLKGIYSRIARELAHQYLIGFEPAPRDGPDHFRQIAVVVDAPHSAIRARTGYVVQ
jgi:Ca-activated chloride channel family protein